MVGQEDGLADHLSIDAANRCQVVWSLSGPFALQHDPTITPDGSLMIFDNHWEIFLGDLAGGEPVRLTYNDGFDGFPSLSPDGTKMLWGRSSGEGFMAGLYTHVMDVSSLNLGPENWTGEVPSISWLNRSPILVACGASSRSSISKS